MTESDALIAREGNPQLSVGTAPPAPGHQRRHDLVLATPQTSEIRTFRLPHHLVCRLTAQRGVPVRIDAGQTGKSVLAEPLNGHPELIVVVDQPLQHPCWWRAQALALSGTQSALDDVP